MTRKEMSISLQYGRNLENSFNQIFYNQKLIIIEGIL